MRNPLTLFRRFRGDATALSLELTLLLISSVARSVPPGPAIFQAPIARVITNFEVQLKEAKSPSEKAGIEFRLGRLYSEAYASHEKVVIYRDVHPHYSMPYDDPKYSDRYLAGLTNDAASKKATPDRVDYLRQAIRHLKSAIRLDPSNTPARLNLAWCLVQAGRKEAARTIYRAIVAKDWAQIRSHYDPAEDSTATPHMLASSSTWVRPNTISPHLGAALRYYSSDEMNFLIEAATDLSALLNPKLDSIEIAQLKNKIAVTQRKVQLANMIPRAVEPIVIPLTDQDSVSDLLSKEDVRFDLDGYGPRKFGPWPTPRAGWLVWDPTHSGKIESGLQLFGSRTFWLFWDNGYQALCALDDNHDGKLEGKELEGLAIWQDLNGDGTSERGEVRSVAEWGITSISCKARQDASGMWYSPDGVTFKDGKVRPTYDLILTTEPVYAERVSLSNLSGTDSLRQARYTPPPF